MALNLKSKPVEALAGELSRSTGRSMTAVVLAALQREKSAYDRQSHSAERSADLRHFLEHEVWSLPVVDRQTPEATILGFDDDQE